MSVGKKGKPDIGTTRKTDKQKDIHRKREKTQTDRLTIRKLKKREGQEKNKDYLNYRKTTK